MLFWQWAEVSVFPEGFEGGLYSRWSLGIAAQEVLRRYLQDIAVVRAVRQGDAPYEPLSSLGKVPLHCGKDTQLAVVYRQEIFVF
jgi:hypothetical protein